MIILKWKSSILCVAALFGLLVIHPASSQAVDIGSVKQLRLDAYGTPVGKKKRSLYARNKVSANEVVETVRDGGMLLSFLDGTEFRLGSSSQVTLDEFVYDPNDTVGKMTLRLSKGVFRFVSGKMSKQGIKLVTPTALIGVRGTDFFVIIGDDNSTSVLVEEGEVEIESVNVDTPPAVITSGGTAVVASSGTISRGVQVAIKDDALTASSISDGGAGNVGGDAGGYH